MVLGMLLAIVVSRELEDTLRYMGFYAYLPFVCAIVRMLRPVVLYMWLKIVLMEQRKSFFVPLKVLLFGYILLCVTSIFTGWVFYYDMEGNYIRGPIWFASSIVVGVLLTFVIVYTRKKDIEYGNWNNNIVLVSIPFFALFAILLTYFGNKSVFDHCLVVCFCLYYFYLSIQMYKRDALTNLLNRHKLLLDMDHFRNETYEIVLIDIDNFKLINDKYGHEKGDDALRTIASIVKKYLPSYCRMYRYGGDEFIILGRTGDKKELEGILEQADIELAENEYSISRGFATHRPTSNEEDVIALADSHMYIDKRKRKSDDIWDMMTGLFNLRGFLDELEVMKKNALAEDKDICLMACDVEHLANINSTYGYLEGNSVIVTLANALQECITKGEFIGHLAGDEFAVALLVKKGDTTYQQEFLEKFTEKLSQARHFMRKEYYIEVNHCFHVVEVSEDSNMGKEVDRVLYQKRAEKENRRKTTKNSSMSKEDYNSEDERTVLSVIKENKFRYAFQPIVSAKTGDVVAYEALMRTATEPMVPPLTILQYAEKHNKMYEIEKATFFNVLDQVKQSKELFGERKLFINSLPGHELKEEDYRKLRINYSELFPRVVMEITEQKELEEEELDIIKSRRNELGFQLAIDDFGSGCSNTNSLLRYMPKVIKLDRLLMVGIDQNSKKQYFVNSIITFAKQNDMEVLAEGIETEAELKMVIRLGVDYIQGYYTAKPSFDIIQEIPEEIHNMIVAENMKSGTESSERKIYVAGNETELSLVHLALEEYTGITVAVPKLVLKGGFDYAADMCIKIIDGLECQLTLKDVNISSVDDLPCIDIGEGARLILTFEGNNQLQQKGIHVPEGSTLEVKGSGKLEIAAKGHNCYGIGTVKEERFGEIILRHSGEILIRVDGNTNIALGGGIYESGLGIRVVSGLIRIVTAAVDAVSIGCMQGDVPIYLHDCAIEIEARVNIGTMIGSLYGKQNISISGIRLNMVGNGSTVTGIGGASNAEGMIEIHSGTVTLQANGQNIFLIGAQEGQVSMDLEHVNIKMRGEGNRVLALGSYSKTSKIHMKQSIMEVVVNAAEYLIYGLDENQMNLEYPTPNVLVNGEKV